MVTMTVEEQAILAELEQGAAERPPSDATAAEAALLNETVGREIELETIIPAGRYLCRFSQVTVKRSQTREERDPVTQTVARKGGLLMLDCQLTVLTGAFAGKIIFDRLMLEGGGTARLAKVASALGFYDHDRRCLDFPKPPTAGEIKARLLNQPIMVETKVEDSEWQGERRKRAVVTFAGYSAAEVVPGPPDGPDVADGPPEPTVVPTPEKLVKEPKAAGTSPASAPPGQWE